MGFFFLGREFKHGDFLAVFINYICFMDLEEASEGPVAADPFFKSANAGEIKRCHRVIGNALKIFIRLDITAHGANKLPLFEVIGTENLFAFFSPLF